MDPRSLFRPGLTVPEHEIRDLHYIGEALPVPSLITTSISIEADANTGGSPVPAREDHVHAVDVDSLIQFINDNPTEIDLTNYYTKAEVDQLLDELIVGGEVDLNNYYTKAQTDALDSILADAIDALDIRVTDVEARVTTLESHVDYIELYWSYGTVVAPEEDVSLGLYVGFRPFNILQVMLTMVASSTQDTNIKVFKQPAGGGASTEIINETLSSGNVFELTNVSTIRVDLAEILHVVLSAVPSGTGEILVVGIRGVYIFPEDI